MLVSCFECGKPISTDARVCPSCGYDYTCDVIDLDCDSDVRNVSTVAGGTVKTELGVRRMSNEEFVESHNSAVLRVSRESDARNSSSGCFIATAAYGTPFAEEIGVLRKFRDEHLTHYLMGRVFISSYYRLSPPIAAMIKQSDIARFITRAALRPVVWLLEKLNEASY